MASLKLGAGNGARGGGVVGAPEGGERQWFVEPGARGHGESVSVCFQMLGTWSAPWKASPSLPILSNFFKTQLFSSAGGLP